jgi:hypothetical protein
MIADSRVLICMQYCLYSLWLLMSTVPIDRSALTLKEVDTSTVV